MDKLTDDEIKAVAERNGFGTSFRTSYLVRDVEAEVASRYEARIADLEGLSIIRKAHIGDLEACIAELEQQTKDLSYTLMEYEGVDQRIAELESQVALYANLIAGGDKTIAELESQLAAMRDIEHRNEVLEVELVSAAEELASAKSKLAGAQKELRDYESDIGTCTSHNVELQQQLAAEQAHRVECMRLLNAVALPAARSDAHRKQDAFDRHSPEQITAAENVVKAIKAAIKATPHEALNAAIAKALAEQWKPISEVPTKWLRAVVADGPFAIDIATYDPRISLWSFPMPGVDCPTHYMEIPPLPEAKGGE